MPRALFAVATLLALAAASAAAASTTTADGELVVGIPDGWTVADAVGDEEVLRLEGPGGFLALLRPSRNLGFMRRGVERNVQAFLAKNQDCKPGPLEMDALPNGTQLAVQGLECRGKKGRFFFGAFPFGAHVYFPEWYVVEVAKPFEYGLGLYARLEKAEQGVVVAGWRRSEEGDVMLPVPPGNWEDSTPAARAKDPSVVAHFSVGENFMSLKRLDALGDDGLGFLAQGLADERSASLGACKRSGAGRLSLPNGWLLHGLALACEGPQGKATYSFGAFKVKRRAYAVFGVYDKGVLDKTVGAAALAEELAEKAAKPIPIEAEKPRDPGLFKWVALAAVPFALTLLLLVFRRKPAVETTEEEVEEADDGGGGPPSA